MKKYIFYLFAAIEAILYISFLIGDIFSTGKPKILKFIAICLIALFSIFAGKEKENRCVTAVFFVTVIADIFFLLMNKPLYGIAVYIIIQLIHTIRLSCLSNKKTKAELLKRIIPALSLGVLGSLVGPVFGIICAYSACIGINIVHCIENYIKNKNNINLRYLIGFIVLVIGDIGVGLRNMQLPFLSEQALDIAYIITWITYLPSLLLILSTTDAFSLKKLK